jgi:uncharacterized protein YqjF (DUF2071 family)
MAQRWHDLLFAHWPVSGQELRRLIPAPLEIDLYQGQAWLGIVPFRMSGVRLRGTPPMPWISGFAELNVRTYVVSCGKPGVWFFSLDAANPLAVAIARSWFHLPYFLARMRSEVADGEVRYQSIRTHRPSPPARLSCCYRPVGDVFEPRPGTLEHFLTERYCLYAADRDGCLYRGEIQHPPWSLQPAEATLAANTMAQSLGLSLPPGEPLLHFAKLQEMVAWSPERLAAGRG